MRGKGWGGGYNTLPFPQRDRRGSAAGRVGIGLRRREGCWNCTATRIRAGGLIPRGVTLVPEGPRAFTTPESQGRGSHLQGDSSDICRNPRAAIPPGGEGLRDVSSSQGGTFRPSPGMPPGHRPQGGVGWWFTRSRYSALHRICLHPSNRSTWTEALRTHCLSRLLSVLPIALSPLPGGFLRARRLAGLHRLPSGHLWRVRGLARVHSVQPRPVYVCVNGTARARPQTHDTCGLRSPSIQSNARTFLYVSFKALFLALQLL